VTGALVSGLVAGYGIAIPIGAVGAYLVTLTARAGLRVGAAAALGVATVDGLYALLAVAGGTALARLVAPVLGVARVLAALVLVAVAVLLVRGAIRRYRSGSGPDAPTGAAPRPARAYAALLGMTALNPTTIVYFVAVVVGGEADHRAGWLAGAVFVLAAFVASASWQLLLAAGGAVLGRMLTGPRGRLGSALVAGAVIVVLAVRLLVQTP